VFEMNGKDKERAIKEGKHQTKNHYLRFDDRIGKNNTNKTVESKVNRRTQQKAFRADKSIKRGASIVGIRRVLPVYKIPAYERKQIISQPD
jgi:hypothetical protein